MTKRARGTGRRQPSRPQERPGGGRSKGRPGARTAPVDSVRDAVPTGPPAADTAPDASARRPTPEPATTGRMTPTRARARSAPSLADRAAPEYVYVGQDLRRIVVVAALLFGTMFVLWVLISMLRLFPV